jgi:beta-N-acetylhexosaminidase
MIQPYVHESDPASRWHLAGGLLAAIAALALAALSGSASSSSAAAPTLAQLVGQHLLVRMQGSTPSAAFLRRIREGEIGGVVLFQNNATPAGVPALVAKLQAAAHAGGQLPLLVAVDQEGGIVKRLPGPPTAAPGAMRSAAAARAQGLATGRYLRGLGIDDDLAPVLDVPAGPSAFIFARAFSTSPSLVATRGVSFAQGVVAGGVAATAKHFPGLGRVAETTDASSATVLASRTALARDLIPFRQAIAAGVPSIMVGTAIYPAYGDRLPAACSPSIVTRLLRETLHFRGVTVSDDLDTAAVSSHFAPPQAAVQAVTAGIDLVLVAGVGGSGGNAVGENSYAALLRAAQTGRLSRASLEASYARIAALKRRFS